MRPLTRLAAVVVVVLAATLLLAPPPAAACLWDSDTLKEESLGMREVADLLRGRIFKHSARFYEDKLAYTMPMLARPDARPERYDDAAVALDKLGRHAEAIRLMEEKERRFPGLYTTQANLGTFHAHAGDLERGLVHLRQAIAQNPDAHFGRERIQVRAIEYLARLAKDPKLVEREELLGLPLDPETYVFVMNPRRAVAGKKGVAVDRDAVLGLAGIIRFGNGERSAHVWFSLGTALAWQGHKQLAIRALRRAERLGHPLARAHGELLIRTIRDLERKRLTTWDAVAAKLDAEWAKGEAWARRQQAAEDRLLARGKRRQVFGY